MRTRLLDKSGNEKAYNIAIGTGLMSNIANYQTKVKRF